MASRSWKKDTGAAKQVGNMLTLTVGNPFGPAGGEYLWPYAALTWGILSALDRTSSDKALNYRTQEYIAANIHTPLDSIPFTFGGGPGPGGKADTLFIKGTAMANNFDYYSVTAYSLTDTVVYNGYEEVLLDNLTYFTEADIDTGWHLIRLKVCRTFGGGDSFGGMDINPPPQGWRRCGTHSSWVRIRKSKDVYGQLTPDFNINLPDSGGVFNYSIMLSNPDTLSAQGTFDVDYTYNDSTYLLLGPYNYSLAAGGYIGPIGLQGSLSAADSSGVYSWRLRVFDNEEQEISVDSFEINKSN